METPIISIIHPSRSRPEQALVTANRWLTNLSKKYSWEYIISVDASDPKLPEYEELFHATLLHVADNKNLVQAANIAAQKSTGEIIILISDDFCCYPNWDIDIARAMKDKSGVLKTFDGTQKWICTLPVMSRDYYEEQGYFYDPGIHHMFSDTLMTHKAELEGKLHFRLDLVFKHNHYSINGNKKDAVTIKADSTWNQGENVYLTRCREWKSKGVDIFNIEGREHVAWLKKKLNVR